MRSPGWHGATERLGRERQYAGSGHPAAARAAGLQRSGGIPFTSSSRLRQTTYSIARRDSSGVIFASPISSAPSWRRSTSIVRVIFPVGSSIRTRRGGVCRPPQSSPVLVQPAGNGRRSVSYTHLRAHETPEQLVCRLLLE